LDTKTIKIVTGLALKNSIYRGQMNPKLVEIYNNPQLKTIKRLYHQLIASDKHHNRESAFWLELAFQQEPVTINFAKISRELQEMEILLSSLMWQVDDDSRQGLNNWLNYLVNVPQSLRTQHIIDAKILMSLAMHSCKDHTVEKIKRNSKLATKIEILQAETIRLYELIAKIPAYLAIPRAHINVVCDLQDVLINFLQAYYRDPSQTEIKDLVRYILSRLEASQRLLMRQNQTVVDAKKEIELAKDRLTWEKKSDIPKSSLSHLDSLLNRLNTLLQLIDDIDEPAS
jgi:hypothetical protein